MKRYIILMVAMLSTLSASAQITAREWIDALNYCLGDKYALFMRVDAYGEEIQGYFMVEEDSYYIQLGTMEVYSNGKLRYEVNNERKEVTEDRVDLESIDLLTNPTNAFEFLDDEFTSSIFEEIHNGVILKLEPKEDIGITAIYVSVINDGKGNITPHAIRYDYEGEQVAIALIMADASSSIMPKWDKSRYTTYDMVSFL
ncbi:MAG: hypothetical protein IKK05_03820 [Alistipes sp.]|nr:hypothetical protein [Alistipes sp.]